MIMNLFKHAMMSSIMGNYPAAIEYYQNFIDKASKCCNDLKSGSKTQSVDEVEAAINLINAWCNLGNVFKFLDTPNDALKCFDEALKLHPKDPLALREMGEIYHEQGEYEKALECFNKCTELNPNDVNAWVGLGILYETMGKLENSIDCYHKALDSDPKNGIAWYNLGVIHDKLAEEEKALDCYQRALKIDPENKHAWVNLGNYHMKRLNLEKAIKYYDKAIDIDPYYEKAWYYANLARDCLRDNDRQSKETLDDSNLIFQKAQKISKKR